MAVISHHEGGTSINIPAGSGKKFVKMIGLVLLAMVIVAGGIFIYNRVLSPTATSATKGAKSLAGAISGKVAAITEEQAAAEAKTGTIKNLASDGTPEADIKMDEFVKTSREKFVESIKSWGIPVNEEIDPGLRADCVQANYYGYRYSCVDGSGGGGFTVAWKDTNGKWHYSY